MVLLFFTIIPIRPNTGPHKEEVPNICQDNTVVFHVEI